MGITYGEYMPGAGPRTACTWPGADPYGVYMAGDGEHVPGEFEPCAPPRVPRLESTSAWPPPSWAGGGAEQQLERHAGAPNEKGFLGNPGSPPG